MKDLVIAEKPNMGKEIAKFLGVPLVKGKKYCENAQYIVTWAYGHLITLKEPGELDEKWEKWSLETLPIFPTRFEYKVIDIPINRNQFKTIKELIHRSDVKRIINAGDDGQEGEYIQQLIYRMAGNKKPVVRACIDNPSESKIREAFTNLKCDTDYARYDRMFLAGECRAYEDYVIGMTISRLICCAYNTYGQSAGRVQTGTLAMVRNRDDAIQQFVSVPYWEVNIKTDAFNATYYKNKQTAIMKKEEAEQIATSAQGQQGRIIKIYKEEKTQARPQLYRLSTLQVDGANVFGYTTEQVLELLQSLYDGHKIVTYPRTESSYINQADAKLYPARIMDIREKIPLYQGVIEEIEAIGLRLDKRIVDESKIVDHGAIMINENFKSFNLNRLSPDEKNILDLILVRMILAVSPDRKYDKSSLVFQTKDGNLFFASGTQTTYAGWKRYENLLLNKEEKENKNKQVFENLQEGNIYTIQKAEVMDKKTNPPKPFSEATLVTAMENISSLIKDSGLKQVMKARGLGTSATRSTTIQKLVDRGYITRSNRKKGAPIIHVTELGRQICLAVPQELTDPEWGADWEEKLQAIEDGAYTKDQFMQELKQYIYDTVSHYKKIEGLQFPIQQNLSVSLGKCPKCGADYVTGRFGAYCTNKCGFSCSTVYGKKLSDEQIKSLLNRDQIFVKGLKNKEGKTYDCYLMPKGITSYSHDNNTYFGYEFEMTFPQRKSKKRGFRKKGANSASAFFNITKSF